MIQFDRVAAASSKTPEDNKNCLVDAYAQPGFCALTKQIITLFSGAGCGATAGTYVAPLSAAVAGAMGQEGLLYVLERAQDPC
mmetsp:Transcript_57103/g.137296  ORF Transcript_57103/g.137296 Transcript_57103/m.137296 type:complete len:83 (-) Transcript_57103:242-490(-)